MLDGTVTRQGNATRTAASAERQRRRLSIAILLLVTALLVVLVKDRDYWFGSNETAATEEEQVATSPSTVTETPTSPSPVAATSSPKHVAKRSAEPQGSAGVVSSAKSNAAETAAEKVQMASINAPLPKTEYPLLAGQTSVQGSVLMQALIAADGAVEDLRVLSGPSILVPAAREAVRQWKFKPFVQGGKPVETQARVTVNFTIDVSDTTARYQQPSITSDGAL
ncbi:MAG: TonB family protein [Acidobacteriaceae bacterium]|nr:TonB family protein [Acidobacteriaceae bacterium]